MFINNNNRMNFSENQSSEKSSPNSESQNLKQYLYPRRFHILTFRDQM